MGIEHFGGYHEIVAYPDNPHIVAYLNDEPTDYPTHWHTPMEILMPIENGYTTHVANRIFHLVPSDILLIAPNVYHAHEAPPTGKRYFLLVDLSVVSDILGVDQILSLINPAVLFSAAKTPAHLHFELQKLLIDICNSFFEREKLLLSAPADKNGAGGGVIDLLEPVVYGKMAQMLTLVAQHYEDSDKAVTLSRDKKQEYVNKMTMVCSYIDSHCTEELSLEKIADMMNFSKYHFSRLFKEFTHESFYRYVTRKRIEYAEQLLVHQKLSVTEAAVAAGYANTSSFIRMFKSVNGCTPLQYRDARLPKDEET